MWNYLKGKKTVALGSLGILLGGIQEFGLMEIVPEAWKGKAMITYGGLVIFVRLLTPAPILKDDNAPVADK